MKYQDLQIPDVNLQIEFIQKWMSGDYTGALEILTNNAQLNSKKFVAQVSSLMSQSLSALEQYYFTNFPDFLELKLSEYNNTINQIANKNEWSSNAEYKVGNFVSYNNITYFCIADNTNQVPPNDSYWIALNLSGSQGAAGITGELKYDWDGAINYNVSDIVYYHSKLWYAIEANINVEPTQESTQWVEFLNIPVVRILVSPTEPINPNNNLIWIKLL